MNPSAIDLIVEAERKLRGSTYVAGGTWKTRTQQSVTHRGERHRALTAVSEQARPPWTRTPIVREAAELNGDRQRALLSWMNDAQGSQIVATSSRTLYPLVEAGLFDASLYYRLNVVLLRIAAPRQEATLNAVCVAVSPAE